VGSPVFQPLTPLPRFRFLDRALFQPHAVVGACGALGFARKVHDVGTYPGVVLPCRILGVVALSQRGGHGKRQRNDRIIAMPVWHDRLGEFERATDLPARLRKEIEQFFLDTTFFTGKKPKIIGWKSPQKARLLVREGEKRYLKRRQQLAPNTAA
jgi:Inorganic pyrophosphatase